MVSIGQFVLCTYDGHKWLGMACEVDAAHKDIEIQFMHPSCPSRSYTWPRCDDICWVPITNILCLLKTPSLTTATGRLLFTQWPSKIYPRYSISISFYMMSKHSYKFDVFIANKITGSSNTFKTKNKSVINFLLYCLLTFQRPSTELVMASVKWRSNILWKQNYYIFVFFSFLMFWLLAISLVIKWYGQLNIVHIVLHI